MKLLNQDFNTISFEDIVNHCKERHPEGIQLDYKEEYPQGDLGKLIAAFSNTRGGLIIIGVKENRSTGQPEEYKGIKTDAKLVERVHQQALSVSPFPNYQVRITDENDGVVFLIIRVYEGDSTPYFVKNDSNIWVKTGNIRNSIDIASPEGLELLYKKRTRADKSRANYLSVADTVFVSGLELEDKKRDRLIKEALAEGKGGEKQYFQEKLGTNTEMCTISIQPFFPSNAFIKPSEIISQVNSFRFQNNFCDFPDLNLRPIPEGAMMFKHAYNGYIECQQIYASGLMHYRFDVKTYDRQSQKPIIYASRIFGSLATLLLSARSFYNKVGYQGVVKIGLDLSIKDKNISFCKINDNNPFFWDTYQEALLPKYQWSYSSDTSELNNSEEIVKLFFKISEDVHWGFGFGEISFGIIQKFLADNNIGF